LLKEAKAAPNLYDVLGISSAAPAPEIKAAFRRLAKSSHPDFNADDTAATRRFQHAHLAYRVLCDAQLRVNYDRHLEWVRFLNTPRAGAVPRLRRFAKEFALVAAMIIVLTPVFVFGLRTDALDGLAAIASQWSGEPKPPPIDMRRHRPRPSSTQSAAIEPAKAAEAPPTDTRPLADRPGPSSTPPAAIEPAKAAEPPPADTPNGTTASAGAPILEALAPDRVASIAVDEEQEPAPVYASANQRAPQLRLSAEMPRDHLPSAPVPAADAPSAPADPGTLDQARRLLRQGERYAAEGNLAVARQYFVRAADLGLAIAATKMAETFEADVLARNGVRGVKPDPAEAGNWRRRALELDARQSEPSAPRAAE
jgi:curved DNA-binding protein CbpA